MASEPFLCFLAFLGAAGICAHESLGRFRRSIPCSSYRVSSLDQIFVHYQIPPPPRCRILYRNTQKTKEWGFSTRTLPSWSDRGLNPSPMAFWEHDLPALTTGCPVIWESGHSGNGAAAGEPGFHFIPAPGTGTLCSLSTRWHS